MTKPIPDGYASITPYLLLDDAAAAIEFYKQAFGATERFRLKRGDKVGHSELQIGDSVVMLADVCPEMGSKGSPLTLGGTPVSIHLYVNDVDQTLASAEKAGATIRRPLENQFYGDRTAMIRDPFGHVWNLATHVEDVSPEEMGKRAAAMGFAA